MPFVVYLIVPSVAVHVTANEEVEKLWFDVHVGAAGAVLSIHAVFEVTFVVLHNPAPLQTFGVTLHVEDAHSVLIVHVTGVHDARLETASE